MSKTVNPFLYHLPHIDLHGESKDIAIFLLNEFINDNKLIKNYQLVIIHGIGQKILSQAVREYLKTDPRIKNYELDPVNEGITIVYLKE